jgi:hypothetical protein
MGPHAELWVDSREPPAFHTFGPESIFKRAKLGGWTGARQSGSPPGAAGQQSQEAEMRTADLIEDEDEDEREPRTCAIFEHEHDMERRTLNAERLTVNLKRTHPADM